MSDSVPLVVTAALCVMALPAIRVRLRKVPPPTEMLPAELAVTPVALPPAMVMRLFVRSVVRTVRLPPVTLVLGGARSGKSRHAEGLLAGLVGPRHYLATAESLDRLVGEVEQNPRGVVAKPPAKEVEVQP